MCENYPPANIWYNTHRTQYLNASRLVLQVSLPNPSEPGVKLRMKWSWSSTARRCSNHAWVIITFIACKDVTLTLLGYMCFPTKIPVYSVTIDHTTLHGESTGVFFLYTWCCVFMSVTPLKVVLRPMMHGQLSRLLPLNNHRLCYFIN